MKVRKHIIYTLFCMLPLTVVAQKISLGTYETSDNGIYHGDILGGKPNGKGKTKFYIVDTYEG